MILQVLTRIMAVFAAKILILDSANCIKIENQLKVITNDCYERLAIGHRLHPRDIYNNIKVNTVSKCQKECTKDGDACKAFSFGIAVKGNATCELGKNFIKETADLKPIGTIADVDFDLYIKKLGCKLVIDPHATKHKPAHLETSNLHQAYPPEKPTQPPIGKPYETPQNNKPEVPQTISYGVSVPNIGTSHTQNYDTHKIDTGYNQKPIHEGYNKLSGYNTQYVKGSLVSISSGPHSYLHPVHQILIGDNPYSYGRPKPESGYTSNLQDPSKDPYEPNQHGNSQRPEYENPKFLSPFDPYYDERVGGTFDPHRPPPGDYDDKRPIQNELRPENSYGNKPFSNGYDHKPPFDNQEKPDKIYGNRPFPSRPPFDNHDRPDNIYGNEPFSSSSHPSDQGKPDNGYGSKPLSNPYDNRPQSGLYDNKPPFKPADPYDDERYKPYENLRPTSSYDRYPPRPQPNRYDSRPDSYGSSNELYKPIQEKPDTDRPTYDSQLPPFRPAYLNNPYYDERPLDNPRPNYVDERPIMIDDRIDGYNHRFRPDFWERWRYPNWPPRPYDEIPSPLRPHYDDYRPSRPDKERPHYANSRPNDLLPKPINTDYLFSGNDRNDVVSNSTVYLKPGSDSLVGKPNKNSNSSKTSDKGYGSSETTKKPLVTESIGVDGEKITSIITPVDSGE